MADKASHVDQDAKSRSVWKRLIGFPSNVKSVLIRLIGLLLASLIFLYLGIRAYRGAREVLNQGVKFSLGSLMISLACQIVGVLLAVALWRLMLGWVGEKAGFNFHLQAFCISALTKKIPGTIWYAISRVVMYDRLVGGGKSRVIAAIALEIASMSSAGFIVFGVGIATGEFIITNAYAPEVIALVVFAVGVTIMFISPALVKLIHRIVRRKWDVTPTILKDQEIVSSRTVIWVLGEIGVICLGAGASFFAIRSMSIMTEISYFSVLVAWGGAVALGPLAMWLPSDVGLKDGVMYAILSPRIGGNEAALAVLFWRIWGSVLEITFGSIGVLTLGKSRRHLLSQKRNGPS